MLYLYAKNEQSDLTPALVKVLRRVAPADVKTVRAKLGKSQSEFALMIGGVEVAT